jgi:hypothetical protein
MITKPAILECTRCGKVYIGWATDRPKRRPMCLKCQARQAWEALSGAAEATKGRGAGGARRSAGKPAKRAVARKKAATRKVAGAAKRR